jgi:2-hydroxy-3-oxopropionate reductase
MTDTAPQITDHPQTLGFVGLGVMGTPMAGHLIAAGHKLFLNTLGSVPASLTDAGGVACATAKEVAGSADIVFVMVPDTPDVEGALFGPNGIALGLSPGKIVVDMSSISPVATQGFAKRIRELGCEYLDAPVSGGEVGAKAATLSIMVGGSEAIYKKVLPLLARMGRNINLIGDNGAGQTAKVANQIIVALNIEAVSEALLFASRAGADPERVRKALLGGFAASRVLEVHGERMVKRTFAPGFRIKLHRKDLAIALSSAEQLGLSLPNTAATQGLFEECIASGGAEWDHSAVVKALEAKAGYTVAPDAAN